MYSSNRYEIRNIFFDTWENYKKELPLDSLQSQILDIILMHPEYHHVLNNRGKYHHLDFKEDNPFLHLSLHLTIREQVNLNRPTGIIAIYQKLLNKFGDILYVEHAMITCLSEVLWEAQEKNQPPDEKKFLENLKKLL